MTNKIESAVRDLIKLCEENNLSITGAIEGKAGAGIRAFEHLSPKPASEEFHNIKTLVRTKGSIEMCLCELSRMENDDAFFRSELEEAARPFASSNPQVFVTIN